MSQYNCRLFQNWETIAQASKGFTTYYGSALVDSDPDSPTLYMFSPVTSDSFWEVWKYSFDDNLLTENTGIGFLPCQALHLHIVQLMIQNEILFMF